jgi:hypothetical protein
MDAALREQVRRRANLVCEYCHFPQQFAELPFQIDHVIPQQHGGPTKVANLALACFRCNTHKGTNLAGIDARSGRVTRLFNPRQDSWPEHFVWDGPKLKGLTAIGRATIAVLRMNRPDLVLTRAALIEEGISFGPVNQNGSDGYRDVL